MLLLGLLFSFLFSTGPDGVGKEGYSIDYPSQETSRSVSEFSNALDNSFTLRREHTNVSYSSTLRKVSELSVDFSQTISVQFFKTSFSKFKIFKRSLDISFDLLIFIGVLRI